MNDKIFYSYNEIHKLCIESSINIQYSFKPEIILAIGGGGLIPSRISRTYLNIPIYVVSLSLYEGENHKNNITIIQWLNFELLKNKRILIIDEVDDTRTTLNFLINKLVNEEQIKRSNIGVFVLHNKKKHKCITIDELNIGLYHPGKEIEDKWIVYPWDKLSTKKTML